MINVTKLMAKFADITLYKLKLNIYRLITKLTLMKTIKSFTFTPR